MSQGKAGPATERSPTSKRAQSRNPDRTAVQGRSTIGTVATERGTVENAPRELQRLIQRTPSAAGKGVMTRRLPLELTDGRAQAITLLPDEAAAIGELERALASHLQYEHLRDIDDAVWHFAAKCWLNKDADHVPDLVETQAREPARLSCYLPVEFLSVNAEVEVAAVRLVPLNTEAIPEPGPWFEPKPPTGCFAVVEVVGTHLGRMAERAQASASHALRVMRIALRAYPALNYKQLRFRLGPTYAFSDDLSGWRQGRTSRTSWVRTSATGR